jgi:hypothetical protein
LRRQDAAHCRGFIRRMCGAVLPFCHYASGLLLSQSAIMTWKVCLPLDNSRRGFDKALYGGNYHGHSVLSVLRTILHLWLLSEVVWSRFKYTVKQINATASDLGKDNFSYASIQEQSAALGVFTKYGIHFLCTALYSALSHPQSHCVNY